MTGRNKLSTRIAGGFKPQNPSLPDYVYLHGRWQADRPALVVEKHTVTWRDFDRRTTQVANGLKAMDLGPGDAVAVVMSNGREMAEALFGIMKAGCCSVPINLSVTDEAMARMLNDSMARAVFATGDQASRLEAIADDLDTDLRNTAICNGASRVGWAPFDDWVETQATTPPDVDIPPDAPCNVIYSSGTTGLPKGILHSFQGRLDWAYDVATAYRFRPGARALCTIGLYSNIMWALMLATLLGGGALHIHTAFDAQAALADIRRHALSHTAMVPVQWQRLVEAGADADSLASMRSAITVGAPMHETLKRKLAGMMPEAFLELYGLTEGILTVLAPEDVTARMGSVGKPVQGCDIRILNTRDEDCAPGHAGEIVSRARYVMPGYLNRPDATAESIWTDASGRQWLRTGDIGRLDEDGFLYIVDRKKDMILSGGQNIFPADIEDVVLRHADVADGCVIGLPHPEWGETPVAVIVLRRAATTTADAIRDWVNDQVGKRQRLSRVILADDLPRNPNGKILKRDLRDAYS